MTEPELNKQMAGVYLAVGVLNEILGEQWVAKYILPGAKPNVLALDETDQLSSAIGHAKIIDLAEVLYNLQPGWIPASSGCAMVISRQP